jgi:hypothetical protein
MKLSWNREDYLMCGSRNDRMGIAWFRAGMWKLRGIRKGLEIGRCPLCNGEEEASFKMSRNKKARYLYKIKYKCENRLKEFQLDGESIHRTN